MKIELCTAEKRAANSLFISQRSFIGYSFGGDTRSVDACGVRMRGTRKANLVKFNAWVIRGPVFHG